ncbi:MAG: hypothetical protein QOI35_2813, partial [Cryptosporangiaceae bacterium]|nr:hypothetical protein [Cryptosporangiaceae bacterium]
MPDLDLDEQLGGLASHAETSGRFADAAALRARGDRMRRDHRRGVVAAGALSVALVASALTGTLLRHSARDGAHPAPPASHPAATDPAGPSVPVEARSDRILPGAWMAPGELPHAPGETWTVGSAPAVAGSPGPSGLVVTFPCESKQLSAAWAGLPSQLSVLGSTDPNRSARQMTLFHPDLQRAGNTLEDLVYGLNKCTSPVKDGSAGLVTDRKSYATSGWAFLPKRSSGDPHPVQLYFARSGTTVTVLRILGGPVPRTAEEYRKVRDTLVERTRVYAEQGTKIYDGSQ